MKRPKTTFLLIALAVIAPAASFALWQSNYFQRTPVAFDPPYPEFNTAGDPIAAVFEGRIPCAVANCSRLKVGLVLYHDPRENSPTTYWLGILGTRGDDRVVTTGRWTTRRGVADYPDAVVYELDASAESELRYYWHVNDNILLTLDERMSPKVGNAAWGYMLSRYAEPYGPRIYR
jgi:hypothetical protein